MKFLVLLIPLALMGCKTIGCYAGSDAGFGYGYSDMDGDFRGGKHEGHFFADKINASAHRGWVDWTFLLRPTMCR
jgi:hypothetical protein